MKFPSYLRQGDTIGITAPSEGVLRKKESMEQSLEQLRNHGYSIVETNNVRTEGTVSGSGEERAQQLHELFLKEEVKAVLTATGGEFLMDILPYVDYTLIKNHPKWVQGYSDPTGLLYTITTKCDIATVYGPNGGSYDMSALHESLENNLQILGGNLVEQKSFLTYQSGWGEGCDGYELDAPVNWLTPNGPVDMTGRLIGGCMDCLLDIIGTKYDATKSFAEKYKEDGLIWYFDIFALKAENVVRGLWQMKEAGWFEYARGFIIGRIRFPDSLIGMDYIQAAQRILGDAPLILDGDIGHVKPQMTIINGARGRIQAAQGKGSIQMWEDCDDKNNKTGRI